MEAMKAEGGDAAARVVAAEKRAKKRGPEETALAGAPASSDDPMGSSDAQAAAAANGVDAAAAAHAKRSRSRSNMTVGSFSVVCALLCSVSGVRRNDVEIENQFANSEQKEKTTIFDSTHGLILDLRAG